MGFAEPTRRAEYLLPEPAHDSQPTVAPRPLPPANGTDAQRGSVTRQPCHFPRRPMASKIGRSSCGMPDQNGHRDPATPEEIWNILREVAESQKETDRRMQETDLRLRKLDELLNGQWGKLMESLVEGDLVRLLNQRRIAVDHTITNAKKNYGERRWEFDILAVNGEEVVVVEVKTTLKVDDVDYFVQRLQDFAELMPEFADRRIYGAVAYVKTDGSVTVHAGRQGLYVIRATGSSASITNAEGFAPRAFGPRSPARRNPRRL